MVLPSEPIESCHAGCVGCHLNRSISLTKTRRCSVDTTLTTVVVVVVAVAGLWARIGRLGPTRQDEKIQSPRSGREANPSSS